MVDVASWPLLVALIVALIAWRGAMIMASLAMPDCLPIDLHRGRAVAVGAAFADPNVRLAAARWIIEKPFNRTALDECAAQVMTTSAFRAI